MTAGAAAMIDNPFFVLCVSSDATRIEIEREAQKLVTEGKAAIERSDTEELRRVVKALWALLPEDSEARKRGFDSGVR